MQPRAAFRYARRMSARLLPRHGGPNTAGVRTLHISTCKSWRITFSPHKGGTMVVTLQDIVWLRLAARKIGTDSIPRADAAKLISAGLIEAHSENRCMRITKR